MKAGSSVLRVSRVLNKELAYFIGNHKQMSTNFNAKPGHSTRVLTVNRVSIITMPPGLVPQQLSAL
jgi:hypothetical protein